MKRVFIPPSGRPMAPHDPSVLELFINRLSHSSCSVLVYIPPPLGLGYAEYVGNLLRSDLYVSGLLVIIFTNCDLIQMLVIMPFDNLKLCNGNDYVPGVDISSRFSVDSISIELLTLASLVGDSP
nr:hypothetical protein [Tanacetum cinerariifolium]